MKKSILLFLDILTRTGNDGKLETHVYQKITQSNLVLSRQATTQLLTREAMKEHYSDESKHTAATQCARNKKQTYKTYSNKIDTSTTLSKSA